MTDFLHRFSREEIEGPIPARFELMARAYADRPAVRAGSEILTYQALNRRANRLAQAILAQAGPGETPVALLFEHEASAIVALLAVLKAGKSYVTLDPACPPARLNYLLADLPARLMVTNSKNLPLATGLAGKSCHLLNIDALDIQVSDENVALSISPETVMAIFYSSDSTGRPKGVAWSHRAMLHRTWLETDKDGIGPADRIALLYSCSSGASSGDIYKALLNGATLCLYDIRAAGLKPLADWLVEEEISRFHLPATLFRQFLDTLTGAEQFPRLRQVTLSGQLYRNDMEQFRAYFPAGCGLVHGLAAAETGMITRTHLNQPLIFWGNLIPAGYPLPDMELLILDEVGKPLGFNQVGEIAVRSRYLAAGYWRRPELTLNAFLPDPEGGEKRIYRLGDLGRLRPDGCLEYLGPKDFYVKIGGYRLEIGEVEAALHSLQTVKEAAVLAQAGQSGEKRLVAYIVPAGPAAPTSHHLRTVLARKLPDYMMPALFVELEALPLTPQGKLDYNRLPDPGRIRPQLGTPFTPPQTPLEQQVAQLWSRVLDIEQVGLDDNFLDLGGHSLLAVRLTSRVFNSFQVELSAQSLFDEAATVAAMAAIIAQHQAYQVEDEDFAGILSRLDALSEETQHPLTAESE
jgi:amino acid adenylation domain-containing protein